MARRWADDDRELAGKKVNKKRKTVEDFDNEIEDVDIDEYIDEYMPDRGPVVIRITKTYGQFVDFMILYHSAPAHVHILHTVETMDRYDMLNYVKKIDKAVGVANLDEVLDILKAEKE